MSCENILLQIAAKQVHETIKEWMDEHRRMTTNAALNNEIQSLFLVSGALKDAATGGFLEIKILMDQINQKIIPLGKIFAPELTRVLVQLMKNNRELHLLYLKNLWYIKDENENEANDDDEQDDETDDKSATASATASASAGSDEAYDEGEDDEAKPSRVKTPKSEDDDEDSNDDAGTLIHRQRRFEPIVLDDDESDEEAHAAEPPSKRKKEIVWIQNEDDDEEKKQ